MRKKPEQHCKRWTAEELAFLQENYKTMGGLWCAKKLGRTVGGIHQLASKRLHISVAPPVAAQKTVARREPDYSELSGRIGGLTGALNAERARSNALAEQLAALQQQRPSSLFSRIRSWIV